MPHLLNISIGPVQDFIAAARRTRDLWFGSHLLSELARAGALELKRRDASLIEPGSDLDSPERDGTEPIAPMGDADVRVGNKLLARCQNPETLARSCRDRIQNTLEEYADEQLQKLVNRGLVSSEAEKIWDEQIEDILEFYATWADFGEGSPLDYSEARDRAEAELAARKNLRNFRNWDYAGGWYDEAHPDQPSGAGLKFKSSLDGARASVLIRDASDTRAGRELRIASQEDLDAIGLLKRAGGEPDQFLPIPNVAAASWLERLDGREIPLDDDTDAVALLEQLSQEDLELPKLQFQQGNSSHRDWLKAFPYTVQLFRPERWPTFFDELSDDSEDWPEWRRTSGFEEAVHAVRGEMPELPSYVACLVADGDHMGRAIDAISTREGHEKFSEALSNFASDVDDVVEDRYRGSLIYAGGDDVLAFLPLDDALDCAADLTSLFDEKMSEVFPDTDADGNPIEPSLSAGLGIGHVMERMGRLLDLGRSAEDKAKARDADQDRNALGIVWEKRSGGQLEWRQRWDAELAPLERIALDNEILQGEEFSTSKLYQIRQTVRRFPAPAELADEPVETRREFANAFVGEVERLITRADLEGETRTPSVDRILGIELHDDRSYRDLCRALDRATDRLLVSRNLAMSTVEEAVTHES